MFSPGFWIWADPASHRPIPAAYAPFEPLFSKGWVGVEVFFVISGFVIAYSTEGATPWRFVQHRMNRLLPGALCCATFTGAVLLTAYPLREVAAEWLRSVSFFPAGPWVDGSYWTLPIEVAFYGLILICLAVKRGRYLPACMGALGCFSTGVCVLALWNPPWTPLPVVRFLSLAAFPPYACTLAYHGTFFALGVFLFLALVHRASMLRVAAICLCTVGCVAELLWHDRAAAGLTGTQPGLLVPLGLWSGAVLLLVAAVVWNNRLQRLVGHRAITITRQVGIATYPLYLLHGKIGQVLIGGLHRRLGYGGALLVAAPVLAGLAAFVAQVLEPPLRAALQRLWKSMAGGELRYPLTVAETK